MNDYTYNPYFDVYSNYLAHHGVKGMHWGVRRYQPYPGHVPKGSKEVGQATKVEQRSDKKLPFYGRKDGSPKTLFYGTRKKRLVKEARAQGMSKSEAKDYAEKQLEKKYGDSNKTYKKVDKAVKVKRGIETGLSAAAAAVTVGSIATMAVMAKHYGDPVGETLKNNMGKIIKPSLLKKAGAATVASIGVSVAKDKAIELEDKYYEK